MGGRIDIEADDVADLGGELRIVGQLKVRKRCGVRPWARQMRWTEVRLTPAALAITRPVQWVVSPGGSPRVKATIRSVTSSASLGTRAGRVLSRRRPSTPSVMNRSCQRQTAVWLTPAARMIVAVPSPSGRRQHDPRAPDVLLRAVAVIDDRLQALAIGRGQVDGDASTHPQDSHDAKAMGIPTRTLTSASIH